MSPVAGWVQGIVADVIGPQPFKVGDVVPFPDGRTVKIMDGEYWAEGGFSNFWSWREVLPDGSLSKTLEHGYGWGIWLKEQRDKVVNDEHVNYARAFGDGIEYGSRWSEFSRTRQYVAIEVPGHSYWTGRLSPRAYARRQVVVVAKSNAVKGWSYCRARDRLEFKDVSTKRLRERVHEAMLRLEVGDSMDDVRARMEAE